MNMFALAMQVEEYDLSSLSQPPYHVRFRQFPPIVGTKAVIEGESSFVDASSELALSPGGAPRDAAGLPTETNARGAGGDGKLGLAHSETATSDASSEAASFFDADEYFYFNPEPPPMLDAPDLDETAGRAGTITIEEVDDETCRHRLACSVQVPMLFRVPGTGRIAETGVRDNMQKATRSLRRIVERWLVMREALLTAEGAEGYASGSGEQVALWKGGTALHWLSKDVLESLRAPSSQTVEALQRGSSGGWRHLGAVLRVARGAEDDAAPRVQRARSRDSVASCGSEPDDASLA
eukprot:gene24813-30228_t